MPSVPPRRSLLAFLAVALLTVGCDHAAKHAARAALDARPPLSLAGDVVRFQLAHNTGGFLSFGERLPEGWRHAFFLLAAPLGVALLAAGAFPSAARHRTTLAGLALLCGGGFANWLDRVLSGGTVTDFVSLGVGPLRTGIFNVADVAILAGALLLLFPTARGRATAEAPREP
jgi:signal peptidase II